MSFYDRLKRLDALHGIALRHPRLTYPLRLVSYYAMRALEVIRGHAHPHVRVRRQAERMTGEAPSTSSKTGPKVLFFTKRGWFAHVGTESVLAKALQARGARVKFFLCGGGLIQCDFKPGTDPHVTPPLCRRCTDFAADLLTAFNLAFSSLSDWVGPDRLAEAQRALESLERGDLEEFVYRGRHLYSIVRPSVQRSLLRGDVGHDALSEAVLRGFLASAMVVVDVVEAMLDEECPNVVVMTNGLFFAEALLLAAAQERGISAITYERGIPIGTVLFDRDKPAIRFDLDAYWPIAGSTPLNEEQDRALDKYLERRAEGQSGVIELWPDMQRDREMVVRRLGIDDRLPTAVLFTNVLWDSAVYGRDVAFEGMFDWIFESIRLFEATPSRQLIIRVHPAEVRIPLSSSRDRVLDRIRAAYPSLPANVRVVAPDDDASSYVLMQLAQAVLVYTSTIGLEAAVRGHSVVVAGRTHYRARGFTIDTDRRDGFADDVHTAFRREGIRSDELELARRYAHLFFLRFMQPFPWLVDTPRERRSLAFSGLEDLDAGRDPVLDRWCDAILEGGDFLEIRRAPKGIS